MAICTRHVTAQSKRKARDYHIPHDRERGDLRVVFIIRYCTSICDNSAKNRCSERDPGGFRWERKLYGMSLSINLHTIIYADEG